jgi:hypothetical protein
MKAVVAAMALSWTLTGCNESLGECYPRGQGGASGGEGVGGAGAWIGVGAGGFGDVEPQNAGDGPDCNTTARIHSCTAHFAAGSKTCVAKGRTGVCAEPFESLAEDDKQAKSLCESANSAQGELPSSCDRCKVGPSTLATWICNGTSVCSRPSDGEAGGCTVTNQAVDVDSAEDAISVINTACEVALHNEKGGAWHCEADSLTCKKQTN